MPISVTIPARQPEIKSRKSLPLSLQSKTNRKSKREILSFFPSGTRRANLQPAMEG